MDFSGKRHGQKLNDNRSKSFNTCNVFLNGGVWFGAVDGIGSCHVPNDPGETWWSWEILTGDMEATYKD